MRIIVSSLAAAMVFATGCSAPAQQSSAVIRAVPQQAAEHVVVNSVAPGQKITSPLTLTGEAKLWYFEASFPVELRDANGTVLVQAPAQAQDDWMTEEFVPFAVTLEFAQPETGTGTLILRKDNPSGLPELDESVEIPVTF